MTPAKDKKPGLPEALRDAAASYTREEIASVCEEAADEIEALRALVEFYEKGGTPIEQALRRLADK